MSRDNLTDTAIRALKPKDKPYKVSDGKIGGMFIAVSTAGGKTFRLAYKFQGKAQQLTLGMYPTISLAEAREIAQSAKKQLDQGTNPAANKKAEVSAHRV